MTRSEKGFLNIDGARLEYCRIGEHNSASPTLVFLHEGLGSVAMWKDFPAQLVKASGLNAFIYSRQSYGKSSVLPLARKVNYSYTEAVDVLPKVLKAANIVNPIFIGHSDGASIALIYAGVVETPKTLGLILMAPHVFNEAISTTGIQAAKLAYEQGDLKARLSAYHDNVDNAFWRWNDIWLHDDFQFWNIEEFLKHISVPVLQIQGENDEYGTKAQTEAIQGQCTGIIEILILAQCGHSPFRDQIRMTLDAICSFIYRHDLKII